MPVPDILGCELFTGAAGLPARPAPTTATLALADLDKRNVASAARSAARETRRFAPTSESKVRSEFFSVSRLGLDDPSCNILEYQWEAGTLLHRPESSNPEASLCDVCETPAH